MALKVIRAGFARTGTWSTKAALDQEHNTTRHQGHVCDVGDLRRRRRASALWRPSTIPVRSDRFLATPVRAKRSGFGAQPSIAGLARWRSPRKHASESK